MGPVSFFRCRSALVLACNSLCLIFAGDLCAGVAPEVDWTVLLPSNFPEGRGIVNTSDGGFIVSGNGLLKTDELGDVSWGNDFEDGTLYPGPAVRQLKDGSYIVGGTFYGNGQPTFVTTQDLAIIKVDPQGKTLWQRAFGGEGEDAGFAIESTADGGYAVTGHNGGLLYIVRTDGNGNLLWEATYGDGGGNSIQETSDSGFIVLGVRSEGAFLLNVDEKGNSLWEKLLSEDGVTLNGAGVVRLTADGGFLVAGVAQESGGAASFLWRTDAEGNLLWRNRFPGPAGLCWLASFELTSDGGAVAVGSVQVPREGHVYGEVDVYVVRINQAGELLWEKRLETPDVDSGHGVVQTPDGGYAIITKGQIDPGRRYASLIKLRPELPSGEPLLRRGDARGDGVVDLSDAVFTLNYLFLGGSQPSCLDSSDTDDDGVVNIADGIGVLQFLFLGGEPPSSPGPYTCGTDPTPDTLSCRRLDSCGG